MSYCDKCKRRECACEILEEISLARARTLISEITVQIIAAEFKTFGGRLEVVAFDTSLLNAINSKTATVMYIAAESNIKIVSLIFILMLR